MKIKVKLGKLKSLAKGAISVGAIHIYSRVLEVRIQQLEEESGSSCSEEEEEDGREGDDTSSEIDFDGDIDDDEDEEEDEGFQDDRSANFTFNLN